MTAHTSGRLVEWERPSDAEFVKSLGKHRLHEMVLHSVKTGDQITADHPNAENFSQKFVQSKPSIQTPQIDKRKGGSNRPPSKAREWDRMFNEGGEGYNPHRPYG